MPGISSPNELPAPIRDLKPGGHVVTRRQFCLGLGVTLGALACSDSLEPAAPDPLVPRLTTRPGRPRTSITPGLYRLHDAAMTALLFVPANYSAATAMPLVIALHGAGASSEEPINFLDGYAESNGFLVLAPDSAGGTWDGVEGIYGPDLETLDWALFVAFDRCNVDGTRVTLEGFSDGASYALGVGITNPEVFTRIVAFSPGFVTNSQQRSVKPRIFVSHGTRDGVLSIDTSSRVIVPQLRADGYDVTYREFDGTHTVPSAIASEAVAFMMARSS